MATSCIQSELGEYFSRLAGALGSGLARHAWGPPARPCRANGRAQIGRARGEGGRQAAYYTQCVCLPAPTT